MGVVGDGSSRLFFFFPDGPQIIKMDHVSSPVQPLGLPYFWRKGCQSLVSGTPAASCLPPTLTQPPPRGVGGGKNLPEVLPGAIPPEDAQHLRTRPGSDRVGTQGSSSVRGLSPWALWSPGGVKFKGLNRWGEQWRCPLAWPGSRERPGTGVLLKH